ncbi:hypothetical protein KBA73_04830 [Patescibacteria group bacterium]|nr:hypothetical protein [Patescibacteria group bacterium]
METPPAAPPKRPRSVESPGGMKRVLALSLAAHTVGIGGYMAVDHLNERVKEQRAKYRILEHQDELREHRSEILQQAMQELQHGRLNVWGFVCEASSIDAELAGIRGIDQTGVEREFQAVRTRFHEHWHNEWQIHDPEHVHTLLIDLQKAFQGYHYYAGMKTISPVSYLRDHGGPCGAASLATLALLSESEGIRNGLRLHYYAEGSRHEAPHMSPTIVFSDQQGQEQEYDLTSGGPAFPSGIRITMAELVQGYAELHNVPVAGNTPVIPRPITIRGGDRGFGFIASMPTDTRPYPGGGTAFYSSTVFGTFHRDAVARHWRKTESDDEQLKRDADRFLQMNYMQQRTIDESDLRPGEVAVSSYVAFRDRDWTELSATLAWADEQVLAASEGTTAHIIALGYAVGLYQLARDRAMSEHHVDAVENAENKLIHYRSDAHGWFSAHRGDTGWIRRHLDSGGEVTELVVLAQIGSEGSDLLFRALDSTTLHFSNERRRDFLKYLLAADQTRVAASERALRLPLYEQFALMGELSAFSFGPHQSGQGGSYAMGAIFSGNDPFSRRYREREYLFSDMTGRVISGMPGADREDLRQITHPVVRSLDAVQAEVESYAHSQGYSEEWINQVTLYSIMRIRSSILSSWVFGVDFLGVVREMIPFLEQSRVWLEAHPEFNETREKEYIQRLINRSHER